MRTSRFAVLAAGLLSFAAGCGSEGKVAPRGELIMAMQTDMELPKDVDKVRIRVATYGNTVFSNDYQVGPSGLKIPATLGLLANPDRPSDPVTIQVIGFQKSRPRVMRESVTTIPVERIATLRVPIEWLCDESARGDMTDVESTCPSQETCVAGSCMASTVDSDDLPDFKPTDIFGGGDGSGNGVCFDTAKCFSNPMSVDLDPDSCGAVLGNDPNLNIALQPTAAGDGICAGDNCLIPLDGGDGGQWSPAGGGARIQLAKGVCERMKAGKIRAVLASTQCATKTWRVPTCGAWSSSGGGGNTQLDSGGGGNTFDAGTGRDAADPGSKEDAATGLDAGVSTDSGPLPDSNTGDDDGGKPIDAGGRADGSTGGNDGSVPPTCQPPPAPQDGGMCMGALSSPPPNGTSPCQWDVPGGIATMGMGFCANLVNLALMDAPGLPGPTPIPQVGQGQCGQGPGWFFVPTQQVIDLCPVSCAPVKDFGTKVQFMYGCPSNMMMPDAGPPRDGPPPPPPPPPDSPPPPPPDGPPPPPPDSPPPPPDASADADAGPPAPMVMIVGGMYQQGCLATDMDCTSDELPLHSVDVSDFSIDETEVTQGAYDLCIRGGMCVAPPCSSWDPTAKANWPVTCVNWTEATSYCNWLGKRLPTEAEWEIAAHGNAGFIYPWGNTGPDCTRANFELCAIGGSQPVRSADAGLSVFNAHDMAGNVGEWVSDWHGSYETLPPVPNPTGPATGSMRVVRGGDYQSQSFILRASARNAMSPNTRVDHIGFRCAKPGF